MPPEAHNNGVRPLDASAEIDRLKEELRRKENMYLRALADFENYRKRVERDRSGAAREGKREIILSLLETLDGFERAVEHMDDDPESVAEGVRAIYRRLLGQLEAQGINQFVSRGEPFDPKLHEAVTSVESDEHEPDTIVDELRRGYRWGDEVLRPARVTVAR
jgi:molecular chaperone GrpE